MRCENERLSGLWVKGHTLERSSTDFLPSLLVFNVWALVVFGMNFKTSSRLKALPAAPTEAVNLSLEHDRTTGS